MIDFGLASRLPLSRLSLEHHAYGKAVPKDYKENVAFRKAVVEWGSKNAENGEVVRSICRLDFLFYVNTFVWAFDPRLKQTPVGPFITYEFQDEAFDELVAAVGNHDILTEKSRDMGASWMFLIVYDWYWKFSAMPVTFLCISRKEDLVDRKGDPDSLFWKLDWINKNQPGWLKPTIFRKSLQLLNMDTGSTIDGDSTTGDVARGGRRTSIALDEFASVEEGPAVLKATADATNCRMFNSTPKGSGNEFYHQRNKCEHVLTLHWTRHPLKAAGSYRANESGMIEFIDAAYWNKKGIDNATLGAYKFIRDGKIRSPWYDRECKRRGNPQDIAQELDIDYLASDFQYFHQEKLQKIIARDVREPQIRGELIFDLHSAGADSFGTSTHVSETQNGPLLLWTRPDNEGKMPRDRSFAAGVDIGAGSRDTTGRGASNSVISIGDRKTMEKVAEYATNSKDPIEFAGICVALCRWFSGDESDGAYMIWEANGQSGGLFGQAVWDLGYRNFYYRTSVEKQTSMPTEVPGWWSTPKTKPVLLGAYRSAMGDPFINRSIAALEECKQYVNLLSGAVVHRSSTSVDDPTQAREAHGDRVIADSLLWWVMKDQIELKETQEPTILQNSYAGRQRERNREKQKAGSWW